MFLSNKLDMLDNKCSEYVLFIFYRAFINFILEYMIYVFKSSVYQNVSCHDFFVSFKFLAILCALFGMV